MDLLFDTCFLIDLERKLKRRAGRAHAFLAMHGQAHAWISWTVAGEFAEGFGDIHDAACAAMLARFNVVAMDEGTAARYARITSQLLRKRLPIGLDRCGGSEFRISSRDQ